MGAVIPLLNDRKNWFNRNNIVLDEVTVEKPANITDYELINSITLNNIGTVGTRARFAETLRDRSEYSIVFDISIACHLLT